MRHSQGLCKLLHLSNVTNNQISASHAKNDDDNDGPFDFPLPTLKSIGFTPSFEDFPEGIIPIISTKPWYATERSTFREPCYLVCCASPSHMCSARILKGRHCTEMSWALICIWGSFWGPPRETQIDTLTVQKNATSHFVLHLPELQCLRALVHPEEAMKQHII